MAYSERRTQQTLAVMRICMGLMFLGAGWYKIFRPEFAWPEFLQRLEVAIRGGALDFYQPLLLNFVVLHPRVITAVMGATELFVGIGLLLGLAVRPVALVGMFYTLNLMCATFFSPGPHAPFSALIAGQVEHFAVLFLLFIFAIAHAGETWGLGALYHGSRAPESASRASAAS